MKITLVAAASTNNAIGKNNHLLWHLPNDMKFFKNTTWSMPVIMGRNTYESVNRQPLSGRFNIVITHHPEMVETGTHMRTAASLQEAIALAEETDAKEVFVAGGGQVYAEALPLAARIVLTRVHTLIDGDVFFPAFSEKEWQLRSNLDFPADEKHQYAYSFQVWERRG